MPFASYVAPTIAQRTGPKAVSATALPACGNRQRGTHANEVALARLIDYDHLVIWVVEQRLDATSVPAKQAPTSPNKTCQSRLRAGGSPPLVVSNPSSCPACRSRSRGLRSGFAPCCGRCAIRDSFRGCKAKRIPILPLRVRSTWKGTALRRVRRARAARVVARVVRGPGRRHLPGPVSP